MRSCHTCVQTGHMICMRSRVATTITTSANSDLGHVHPTSLLENLEFVLPIFGEAISDVISQDAVVGVCPAKSWKQMQQATMVTPMLFYCRFLTNPKPPKANLATPHLTSSQIVTDPLHRHHIPGRPDQTELRPHVDCDMWHRLFVTSNAYGQLPDSSVHP